ncbi:MAG: hypothetical protein Q7R87_03070 [Nanoarchaeota archaeon]|nr:hypothetical protein [Nanoarchaeota archaeon]
MVSLERTVKSKWDALPTRVRSFLEMDLGSPKPLVIGMVSCAILAGSLVTLGLHAESQITKTYNRYSQSQNQEENSDSRDKSLYVANHPDYDGSNMWVNLDAGIQYAFGLQKN